MEIIRGKQTSFINTAAAASLFAGYESIHVDIGTGDGRLVRHLAARNPQQLVIGIDANRENLQDISRRSLPNTLFVIANAQALPAELDGTASQITINFPWGSLLRGLVADDAALMRSLLTLTRVDASLDIRLNAGALNEVGRSLEEGAIEVRRVLIVNGFEVRYAHPLTATDLKAYPTTWAKRLAFGRDPRAIYLHAVRKIGKLEERAISLYPDFTLSSAV